MVQQHERLLLGEKWFVAGIMSTLATEAALTVITAGMHFSWIGVVLGVAGFCLVLFLANRLYAGDKQAQRIALGWVAFQIAYAGLVLYFMASSAAGAETARQLGAPAAWPVVLKAIVYLSLGWILLRMPTVRDFFAGRRGEVIHHDPVAETQVMQAPAVPIEFTADQTEAVGNLAKYLRLDVMALLTLGALQILGGALHLKTETGWHWLSLVLLVQGLLTAALGLALGGPANETSPLTDKEVQTKGQLLDAFDSFSKFFKVQMVLGLVLAAALAFRFFITLRGGMGLYMANATLEFTPEQQATITKMATAMKLVAGVLLLVGGILLAGGLATLLFVSASGLLSIIEGAVTALLGLIMLSSSTDVRYMVETKYTAIHLGNAFRNLTVYYQTQFGLALLLILIAFVRLFTG